jgi:lipopolysaccharide export system permease protein
MEGILIYDEREKGSVNTIFAQEGFLINNPSSQEVSLKLLKGNIHRFESKTKTYQQIGFDSYDLRIEIGKTIAAIEKNLKDHEMSIEEIKRKIEEKRQDGKDTTELVITLHRLYAIPFACIIFGLIGVPLGIQPRRSGRSYGFVFALLIILAYYISLIAFGMLAMRKMIPASLAGWSATIMFGSLGIYLLVKAANESPFKPAVWVVEGLDLLRKKWRILFDHV